MVTMTFFRQGQICFSIDLYGGGVGGGGGGGESRKVEKSFLSIYTLYLRLMAETYNV